MSEIKWIKITTDIFDDEKIRLIDALPDHDAILVIWFKILALAGKHNRNGLLMMSDKVHYTDEMLATIFRRPLNTVRMALGVFEQFGMVEIIDGIIALPNWEKHQNIDGMEKIKKQTRNRVARYREKQKNLALGGNVTCNVTVTKGNATEKERDKNKIRLDKDKNITTTSSKNILELFQSEFRRLLSGFEIEEINHLLNENDAEIVKEALKTAIKLGKPNVKYIGGILRNWQLNQVTTVEQVRQSQKQHQEKKSGKEVTDEWGF
ncbi:phage replisome organizer N-terminal domain-containing protein [Streptococcus oralis]|uniref:phage replisome organizer N-terminal domain-containing protein n=1 Tax=Streptococcus oralis TaxID=1303 RepID=UPI0022839131|nr:phage replisome organizer N-terminal domain-containing protein [Streptococcus oralis]MCY7065124.1 phage replisome organizer N-terminal domain-containing protein [Streptococcus oralis]